MIIAEIGHNHNGDMVLAKDLIEAAAESGAHIAKFQLYDIDTIKKPGDTNYDELKKAQLTKDDMFDLYEHCIKIGIEFGLSVFSIDRLEWTDEIYLDRIKLASRSVSDSQLVREVLKRGLPIIASSSDDRIYDYSGLIDGDLPKISWLFCRSRRQILREGMKGFPKVFADNPKLYTGFSDHTIGMDYAFEAIDRGAWIIEKHFTFDKNSPGWDQPASMTPDELKMLREYFDAKR
jgi:sialic acid synthase SpsE